MANKQITVIKRNGTKVPYSEDKIIAVIEKAFNATGEAVTPGQIKVLAASIKIYDGISVEEIQTDVQRTLMIAGFYKTAEAFILYRAEHAEDRMLQDRLDYMEKYTQAENAATGSETDANANVTLKNVANQESEVWKKKNRQLQRRKMKILLKKLYPEVANDYVKDIENHIIYINDEASSPTQKAYCSAVTLYPLMLDGTGPVDGVTPGPPNDIQSFSGQITNLVFLLSSQVKGAVALGDYLVALNFYIIQEFGEKWYDLLDEITTTAVHRNQKTVKSVIRKGMKQFIYGVNQPAGNRSYNSPFSNISFYDKTYFNSLFEEFYYPDGTKPEWKAIDTLQRIFMELHRELRLEKPLTFPVTTMAMVHDNHDIIDKDYKKLCAEEWAKGGSFFAYISNSATSLSSCCRVLNEVTDNTFSSTIGLTGIMTGSCNVITLNLNRIIQNFFQQNSDVKKSLVDFKQHFKPYLTEILERVYKYHIAYKSGLYEMEERKMFTNCNAGYIYIKKLYSTIGLLGYCEAAQFLGLNISNNQDYKDFLAFVFGIVKEQNKQHSIRDSKHPYIFNSEAVPGENMAVKFYQWDKADGYWVPEDQNLYSSYFFKQWDKNISVLDKLKLHGRYINESTDGGQACHIHLNEHLSAEQYTQILDLCIKEGVNYFTFNIPMSECKDCGHTVNAPIYECPKCGSKNIDWWVRIIGFLRPISAWSKERQIEASKRVYSNSVEGLC